MTGLIWGGTALSLAGVAVLMWCVVLALRARRGGLPDADLRARLQRIVALNLGALAVSALGLALVVVGIVLG